MKDLIRVLACLVVAAACSGCVHRQMLLVTPYEDRTPRVKAMADVLTSTVRRQGYSCRLDTFNMDIYSHPTEIWREQRSRMAVVRARAFNPAVVFVTGDEAARYFAQRLAETSKKFIFLGVKGDPANYGFTKSLNVTGVREIVPVKETFALMRKLVPTAKGVAVLADRTADGDAVVSQIERAEDLPIPVVAVRRARTLAEWMAAVAELQTKADILCIASYRSVVSDEKGRNALAPRELLKMTSEANRLPDCSFWPEAVAWNGVLAAVTVPIEAQAKIAAKQAIRVIYYGENISKVRMTTCAARETFISSQRAAKLGIAVRH